MAKRRKPIVVPETVLEAALPPARSPLELRGTATFTPIQAAAGETPKLPKFSIFGYSGAPMTIQGHGNLVVALDGLKPSGASIPLLWQHDPNLIIGQSNAIVVNASGLHLSGALMGDGPEVKQVVALSGDGFNFQASLGAEPIRKEFLSAGKRTTINGREVTGPMLLVHEATLKEISLVPFGADSHTSAAFAASANPGLLFGETDVNFEQWVRARGFDPGTLNDAQRTSLRAIYDAEQARPPAPAPPSPPPPTVPSPTQSLDEVLASQRAENLRVAEITRITSEIIAERPYQTDDFERMARAAVVSRSTVQEYELGIMRATRATASPPGLHRGDGRIGGRVIEAAVCMSCNLANIEVIYDQQTLNAADTRFPQGIGLRDLFLIVARENGQPLPQTTNDVRGLLQAAFNTNGRPSIRADDGFSTINISTILSNIANKFLFQGFMSVESAWKEITGIRPVRDFKWNTGLALTGGLNFNKVGPGGELTHGTLGETVYSIKADTYGRMLAITRQSIIDDDQSVLSQTPARLGRGAALGLNLGFWTEFLANRDTFYSVANGNLVTGAGSALSTTSLTSALMAFRKQIDPDGNPLGITPAILLVPPELEITASELMTSNLIVAGEGMTATKAPDRNVWSGKYKQVASSYLSNPTIPNSSPTHWFLTSAPADLSVIETAFLNGRQTPIVESADADFNVLGVQLRGYFDWGVSKMEFRAAVRSAGA